MNGIMACSNIPPMTEVAGGAAKLFDPYNPNSIAKVILQVISNKKLQNELRKKANKRAKELSWDKCGEIIWKAAKNAVK